MPRWVAPHQLKEICPCLTSIHFPSKVTTYNALPDAAGVNYFHVKPEVQYLHQVAKDTQDYVNSVATLPVILSRFWSLFLVPRTTVSCLYCCTT
jgi:hypothetical protein